MIWIMNWEPTKRAENQIYRSMFFYVFQSYKLFEDLRYEIKPLSPFASIEKMDGLDH